MRVYSKTNSIVETEIGDDLLLFDQSCQRFFALNVSGKIIWKNLTGEIALASESYDRTMRALRDAFGDAGDKDLRDDVKEFFEHLSKAELLVPCAQDSPRDPDFAKAVTVSRLSCPYTAPVMQEIPIDWLKEQHPAAFLTVAFSDTWNPSSDITI